jgi:hypothetical protein
MGEVYIGRVCTTCDVPESAFLAILCCKNICRKVGTAEELSFGLPASLRVLRVLAFAMVVWKESLIHLI